MIYDGILRGSSYNVQFVLLRMKSQYIIEGMEELTKLKLCQRIQDELSNSGINNRPLDQVAAHCKRDHLNPSPFADRKNVSSYNKSFTPLKNNHEFSHPTVEKQLQQFRKQQNTSSGFSNLPNISSNSFYQNAYQGRSLQKIVKAKENNSWFLKMNWALNPTSNYQKQFMGKNGTIYNKQNKQRTKPAHLYLANPNDDRMRVTNYRSQFKAYTIVKEAQLSIGGKDHLVNQKTNEEIKTGQSEYQRRYDSVMELVKPKQTVTSIYSKQTTIARKPKHQI